MDYSLLMKVGTAIDLIVKGGYVFSMGILARTGFIYYRDYKHSVEQDRIGVD